jgi:dTDP-4-dehydrorhamnose reductase
MLSVLAMILSQNSSHEVIVVISGNRILIIGGSGLLGKYLLQSAPPGNYITATWCRNYQEGIDWQMDITKQSSIHYVFDAVRPDYVIMCSAIGSVDYCEQHYKEAWAVNVTGVQNVVSACQDYDSTLMYCSSNAVFAGDDAPYYETDPVGPVNRYGRMKVAAEEAVSKMIRYHIVRPIMLYGWPYKGGRGNWVTFVTESLKAGKIIHIVDDVNTQPTYALNCAKVMWDLLGKESGVWHIGDIDVMNLFTFAKLIAHVWGLDKDLIHAIKSSDPMLKDMAPRPVDPTYCTDKVKAASAEYEHFTTIDGLRRMWYE